jgi:hypothetical protein
VGLSISPQGLKALVASVLFLSTLAVVCQAPETPAEPLASERSRLASKYVQGRLGQWQGRLKLQDWHISIVMSHPIDLRQGTLGSIRWDLEQKTAVIRVLDASDYHRPFRATLKDMEFTVVHELIHLEFASMTRNEASRREEEHAVNHVADALLQLDVTNDRQEIDATHQ